MISKLDFNIDIFLCEFSDIVNLKFACTYENTTMIKIFTISIFLNVYQTCIITIKSLIKPHPYLWYRVHHLAYLVLNRKNG